MVGVGRDPGLIRLPEAHVHNHMHVHVSSHRLLALVILIFASLFVPSSSILSPIYVPPFAVWSQNQKQPPSQNPPTTTKDLFSSITGTLLFFSFLLVLCIFFIIMRELILLKVAFYSERLYFESQTGFQFFSSPTSCTIDKGQSWLAQSRCLNRHILYA